MAVISKIEGGLLNSYGNIEEALLEWDGDRDFDLIKGMVEDSIQQLKDVLEELEDD